MKRIRFQTPEMRGALAAWSMQSHVFSLSIMDAISGREIEVSPFTEEDWRKTIVGAMRYAEDDSTRLAFGNMIEYLSPS